MQESPADTGAPASDNTSQGGTPKFLVYKRETYHYRGHLEHSHIPLYVSDAGQNIVIRPDGQPQAATRRQLFDLERVAADATRACNPKRRAAKAKGLTGRQKVKARKAAKRATREQGQ